MLPLPKQFHAGISCRDGTALWHMWDDGGPEPHEKYFSGDWYDRTPKELLDECRSIIVDLLENHPELKDDYEDLLINHPELKDDYGSD